VEDRTSDLYLELCNLAPSEYVRERVKPVGALPGVSGVTWWANAHPNRSDLPRVLDEFSLLGLYEVDSGFEPPNAPAGLTGLHFRRTPRPSQGSLSGEETNGVLLVLISPRNPTGAQALRDWADFVHIRHIAEAAVPGYRMITPYRHANDGEPLFLHLYEMVSSDPEATFRSMTPVVARRLGGSDTAAYREWAVHSELRIFYVNTFRLLGQA
jgi:hypothetical protein